GRGGAGGGGGRGAPGAAAGTRGGGSGGGAKPPLDSGAVATSASRLGLTVFQTPATVPVVDQQTMREQGYRPTAETANGAPGVLSVDVAAAPARLPVRRLTLSQVH